MYSNFNRQFICYCTSIYVDIVNLYLLCVNVMNHMTDKND